MYKMEAAAKRTLIVQMDGAKTDYARSIEEMMKLNRFSFAKLGLCFLVASCSKTDEPISLVCTGTETVSGFHDSEKFKPEISKVQRTYRFFIEARDIKRDSHSEKTNQPVNKSVWVFQSDEKKEIYDVNTRNKSNNDDRLEYGFVTVDENELTAKLLEKGTIEGESYVNDYALTINRLSGAFKQIETTKSADKLSITSVTEGICTKGERKF